MSVREDSSLPSSKSSSALAQPLTQPSGGNRRSSRVLPPKSLYLFYHHYPHSPSCYSLYKIDLDLGATTTHEEAERLSPILEFPNIGIYATWMRCARLGSKLYILGGMRPDLVKNIKDDDDDCEVFPRDVYVFDMMSCKGGRQEVKKMDARLNTGKPDPCVFAANGKLYALGSIFLATIPVSDLSRMSGLVSSIKLFECFDPNTNEWQYLKDPPVDRLVHWAGCTVLEQRQQVVFLGWEPCRGDMVHLVYDLKQGTWTRYGLPDSNVTLLDFQEEADGHGHFYGLSRLGYPLKSKSGIVSYDDEVEVDYGIPVGDGGLVEISIHGKPRQEWVGIRHPYLGCTSRLLSYVGNGHFCYIVAGMLAHPDHDSPDRWGYRLRDECTRGITIILFKEIYHDDDDDNIDGHSTTKSEGENYFESEILHSKKYVMPAPFYNVAELVQCFVVSPEQPQKLNKKKKKKKKKNKNRG